MIKVKTLIFMSQRHETSNVSYKMLFLCTLRQKLFCFTGFDVGIRWVCVVPFEAMVGGWDAYATNNRNQILLSLLMQLFLKAG